MRNGFNQENFRNSGADRFKKSAEKNNEENIRFGGVKNGYQIGRNAKSSREGENLSFQEWTEKYHQ